MDYNCWWTSSWRSSFWWSSCWWIWLSVGFFLSKKTFYLPPLKARTSRILLHNWLFDPTRKFAAFSRSFPCALRAVGSFGLRYRGFSAVFPPSPKSEGLTMGRHQQKKTDFFSEKLQNSETPRPLPAWRPQFFLIRKFWNWRDPPPFGEKFRNILSFFW